jgi:hypothetical protein
MPRPSNDHLPITEVLPRLRAVDQGVGVIHGGQAIYLVFF